MKEKLTLMAYFNSELVKKYLIPEIEECCIVNQLLQSEEYEIFQKEKLIINNLYFHHSYAEKEISIGQEYKKIAYRKDRKSEFEFMQDCHTRIACFIGAAFCDGHIKARPFCHVPKGWHGLCIIHFKPEIPQAIYERLDEITALEQRKFHGEICLYAE